jgi:hypothetical protein
MFVTGSPPRGVDGVFDVQADIRLVDRDRSTATTIVSVLYKQVAIRGPGSGGVRIISRPPFSLPPVVATYREGFVVAHSSRPELKEYTWTGGLRRILSVAEPPTEITDEQWRAAIRALDSRTNAAVAERARGAYRALERPEFGPAFRSVMVDAEGWLWAQVYEEPQQATSSWLLFDRDGRGRGSVLMPAGLSVRSIGYGYVAGVWRDELDVEYVRVHRIDGRQ